MVESPGQDENLAPADLKNLVSFPRYGRLKLKLLFDRTLHSKIEVLFKWSLFVLIFKGLNSSGKARKKLIKK